VAQPLVDVGVQLSLGVLVFAVFAIGGNAGWAQLARLMAGLALLSVANNRSETLSGMSGPVAVLD
jgi:hypothetical protein